MFSIIFTEKLQKSLGVFELRLSEIEANMPTTGQQPRPLISVVSCIRTPIVRKEGKCADHWTTLQPRPLVYEVLYFLIFI